VQICIWPSSCHCHSLSLASVKSRLVFTFLVPAHMGSPGQGPLNGCVCMLYSYATICMYCTGLHSKHGILSAKVTYIVLRSSVANCTKKSLWVCEHEENIL